MKCVVFVVLCLLFAVNAQDFTPEGYFLHHDRVLETVPHPFVHIGHASVLDPNNEYSHEFYIALPQRNVDKLKVILHEISNPLSSKYSQWLSKDEVNSLVASEPAIVSRVLSFLEKHSNKGLISAELVPAGDAIKVTAKTPFVEAAFKTSMHAFATLRGFTFKYVGPFYIPTELRDDIVMVSTLGDYAPLTKVPTTKAVGDSQKDMLCNTAISMRALYNMTDQDTADGIIQEAFANAGGRDGFGEKMLARFQDISNIPSNPVQSIMGSGRYTPHYDDGEANLDIQMLTSLGLNAVTNFFIVAGSGWMYEYTQEIQNYTTVSDVHSLSYGFNEASQCGSEYNEGECKKYGFPNFQVYIERSNTEFLKLTSQGQTFLDASGDAGVSGMGPPCKVKGQIASIPEYPESSPYMTIVGSTVAVPKPGSPQLDNSTWDEVQICQECKCNRNTHLTATTSFDSGGGFSLVSPMPDWQQDAVSAYFAQSGVTFPLTSSYNASNRAFPDVAAIGDNVAVYVGGVQLAGGTSASTPEFAGLVSSLNKARKDAGKNVLGFINPLLYHAGASCPDCYFDVVEGFNGPGPSCKKAGFYATPGWDPVTGWGHMNYGNFKRFVLSLP